MTRPGCVVLGLCLSAVAAYTGQEARTPAAPTPSVLPIDGVGLTGLLSDAKGDVVVLNFWATWCVPCIEEFPDLMKIRSEYASKGLNLILVSIDELRKLDTDVRRFLRKMDVGFPTYIKWTRDDEVFINSVDPAWRGAIPATFVFDRQGKLAHSLIDTQTFETLSQLINPLLNE